MDNDDPTQWIIRLSRTSSRFGSVARGNRASRSHNKVIVWSTTLSISLDGDQSKQEDSVKRRINQSDRHKFWHKFCINKGGGGGGGRGTYFLWIINGTLFFLGKNNLSLLFLRKINWRSMKY